MDDLFSTLAIVGLVTTNILVYTRLGACGARLDNLEEVVKCHASRIGDVERIAYKIDE